MEMLSNQVQSKGEGRTHAGLRKKDEKQQSSMEVKLNYRKYSKNNNSEDNV